MKLAILTTFLFIAAVYALPVVEVNEGEGKELVKNEGTGEVPSPLGQPDREEQQTGRDNPKTDEEKKTPEDDLKTDATFWGGYRHYGYGGWGGYYYP